MRELKKNEICGLQFPRESQRSTRLLTGRWQYDGIMWLALRSVKSNNVDFVNQRENERIQIFYIGSDIASTAEYCITGTSLVDGWEPNFKILILLLISVPVEVKVCRLCCFVIPVACLFCCWQLSLRLQLPVARLLIAPLPCPPGYQCCSAFRILHAALPMSSHSKRQNSKRARILTSNVPRQLFLFLLPFFSFLFFLPFIYPEFHPVTAVSYR